MRFVIQTSTVRERLAIFDARFKARMDNFIPDTCAFIMHGGSRLGMTTSVNARIEYLDLKKCEKEGIEVGRSLYEGNEASILFVAEKMYTFQIVADSEKFFKIPKEILAGDLSKERFLYSARLLENFFEKFGVKTDFIFPNNCVVKGTERKLSGFGPIIKEMNGKEYVILLGTLMVGFDNDLWKTIDDFYKLPGSKFADKKVKKVSDRITTIEKEIGRAVSEKEVIKAFKEAFTEAFGESLEDYSFDKEKQEFEKEIIDKLMVKHASEDWIKYGST